MVFNLTRCQLFVPGVQCMGNQKEKLSDSSVQSTFSILYLEIYEAGFFLRFGLQAKPCKIWCQVQNATWAHSYKVPVSSQPPILFSLDWFIHLTNWVGFHTGWCQPGSFEEYLRINYFLDQYHGKGKKIHTVTQKGQCGCKTKLENNFIGTR